MILYMTIVRSFSVLVLAVVLLSGCQPTSPLLPAVPHAPTETAIAVPTPTPSEPAAPTRETGLEAPRQIFEGDCSSLFSDEALSDALGVSMTVNLNADRGGGRDVDVLQATVEQLGGMQCDWSSVSAGKMRLWAFVYPDGTFEYTAKSHACVFTGFEGNDCRVDSVEGGAVISGVLGSPESESTAADLKKSESQRAALLALFADRVNTADIALAPIPAVGAWNLRVDCEAVVAKSDLSAVPGLGAAATGERSGWIGGYLPHFVRSLYGDSATGCVINGESAQVFFTALGGLRWKGAASVTKSGARPLDVKGVDAVFMHDSSSGTHTIDVLDGPNWLQFEVKYPKNAGPIALALVAALDATAAQ
jgi:hypothetical protein